MGSVVASELAKNAEEERRTRRAESEAIRIMVGMKFK